MYREKIIMQWLHLGSVLHVSAGGVSSRGRIHSKKHDLKKKIAAVRRVFEKHEICFSRGLSYFFCHFFRTMYSYWCGCMGRREEDVVSCGMCQ
mgnify:CR=1 FL=1